MGTPIVLLQEWSAAQLRWDYCDKQGVLKETASILRKGDPTVPFVSRYDLPKDQDIGAEETISKIDGLLSLHVVKEQDRREAIAYWKSRDHFEKSRDSLEKALGATTNNYGLLGLVITPERWPHWLTVPKVWAAVATVVAVFSTIEALRNDYSWLLSEPKVTNVESEGTKNFTVGEPIVIDRKIVNTGKCSARIEIRKQIVADYNGGSVSDAEIEMPKEIPEMAELEPNKSDVFPIRARGLKAGTFDIEYGGHLTNGWLGGSDWKGLKQRVRIWQDYSIAASPEKITCPQPGQECYLSGVIQFGRAAVSGVKCEAWLVGKPGVSIESVQMNGNWVVKQWTFPLPPGASSDTVTKLEWTTTPIDKFTEKEFTLGLKSVMKMSKGDWSEIVKLVAFRISEAK